MPESTAAASWNNVQATVTGPAGTAVPDSIRLEFQVTYQTPTTYSNSFIVNGLGWAAFPFGLTVNGAPMTLTAAGTPLQAGEQPVQALANGSLTGFFHLDLPVSALGTSQQFSLGLGSDLAGLGRTLSDSETLSLAGIYLPDGTPISADGYNMSFGWAYPYRPSSRYPTGAIWPCGSSWLAAERRFIAADNLIGLPDERGQPQARSSGLIPSSRNRFCRDGWP